MIEEKNKTLKITFTLHEIKQLVIDNIEEAHSFNKGVYSLSTTTEYSLFHSPLINFYKKNKKIQPTMADKLTFVLLLSYPKCIIRSLNDISDIRLYRLDNKDDNTDFIYRGELSRIRTENEHNKHDCICSYEKLQKIHIVENRYSGIKLQVGSECITQHKIISSEEMKKFKETDKLLTEKRKEFKEGKPIGYYEEERKRKREENEINRLKKENEKIQTKIKRGNFKICYSCDINIADIRKVKLCICNKCKNDNYEELCCQIKKYGMSECENCEKTFIDVKQDPYLCKICKTNHKIIKCDMSVCPTFMVVDITENNVFCDDCEKKIIKCVDCRYPFIKNGSEIRCNSCQYNYEHKLVNKLCVRCDKEMPVKKTELWRTYCKKCYIDVQDTIKHPPKCKCGLDMTAKTIKRDGENKGRKALGCPKFPNGCNEFKML